jgi:hypothetical protein
MTSNNDLVLADIWGTTSVVGFFNMSNRMTSAMAMKHTGLSWSGALNGE